LLHNPIGGLPERVQSARSKKELGGTNGGVKVTNLMIVKEKLKKENGG